MAFPDTVRGVLEVDLGDVVSRVRVSPGLVVADENSWAARMQAMRMRFGKDSKRIYDHFIVSPDPDDKVFAGECADAADEWAEAMLPGSERAVVVHDDNKNGIIHAHVVVNTVHPKAGYKIQVSDGDIYHQWDKLQRICEDHGLVFYRPGGRRACREGARSEARLQVRRGRAPGAPGRRLRRDVAREAPRRCLRLARGWRPARSPQRPRPRLALGASRPHDGGLSAPATRPQPVPRPGSGPARPTLRTPSSIPRRTRSGLAALSKAEKTKGEGRLRERT